MEEKLDFSLPEKRQKKAIASGVIIVLLLILTGLVLVDLFLSLSGNGPTDEPRASFVSAEQTKQLAAKLAQGNLSSRAAN